MSEDFTSRVRNDLFQPDGLDRGAGFCKELCWYVIKSIFFLSPIPFPQGLKAVVLRLFGAKVGKRVYIKPRVNIHFPWKLEIGDHAWLGEEVFILNLEMVQIGNHACLSQRTFLCTGNHDYHDPKMFYRNAPIIIHDGVWVGAQCFVGPGVVIDADTVVTAGSVVTRNLAAGMICSGNPCEPRKVRWSSEKQ